MAFSKLVSSYDYQDGLSNVIVPLSLNFEEVIFLSRHTISERRQKTITTVLTKHKKIKVIFKKIEEDKIDEYLNDEYAFDISSRKYLSFLFVEKNENQDIYYFDYLENVIKNYRTREVIECYKLGIEDLILLGGGKIISNLHKTPANNETNELISKTVEYSLKKYATFTNFVSKVNGLVKSGNETSSTYYLNDEAIKKLKSDPLFEEYQKLGLYKLENNRFSYFNSYISKCFEISGLFLESYLYLQLKNDSYYQDVMMSVMIDFSNSYNHNYPSVCEIDCLLVRDNRLVFGSCKSNKVTVDNLNEIKVHNVMFGNYLSVPLIISIEDLSDTKPSIYLKAEELGIYLIDGSSFIKGEVNTRIKTIFTNQFIYDKVK